MKLDTFGASAKAAREKAACLRRQADRERKPFAGSPGQPTRFRHFVMAACLALELRARAEDEVVLAHRKGGDPEEWPRDLQVREFPA